MANYLVKHPKASVTIYSSASYRGDRPGHQENAFARHFATVLRDRTRLQSQKIKQAIIAIDHGHRFAERIHTRGLGDDGAYTPDGKGLGIRTRVILNKADDPTVGKDPYLEKDVQLILPVGKKAVLETPLVQGAAYPIIATSVVQQGQAIEKLMQANA